MKTRLFCLILCLILLLCSLSSCAGWKGYEKTDLSHYVTLGTYIGVGYDKLDTEVSEKELNEEIDKILSDHKKKTEITDRPSQKDDYILIDHTCKVEAGEIPALSGQDQTYAVGSKYTLADIEGFSDSLIGKSKGESYTFTFTFPADYKNDKISDISFVAGKAATMEVTIDSVFTYKKPELTDDLVKTLSETASTVDQYKAEIYQGLCEKKLENAKASMQEQVWDTVLKNAEIKKYPEQELERYRQEMQEYYEEYAEYCGYEFEEFIKEAYGYTLESFEEKKEEYAKSQLKNDLVLHAIAQIEGITISDEEYEQGLQRYFDEQGEELGVKSKEEFEEQYTKEILRSSLIWEKVIDFLCAKAVGTDAPQTSDATESPATEAPTTDSPATEAPTTNVESEASTAQTEA